MAYVVAHCLQVLVDDNDLGIAVFAQVFAEEVVGAAEGIAEDDDSVGTEQHLGGLVPGVDVMP